MSLDNIIHKILADAQAEVKCIENEGLKEIEERLSKLKQEAEDYKERNLKKIYRIAAEEQQRLIITARLELRKQTLIEKQAILDKVFSEAFEKLKNLPEKEYLEYLFKLLINTVESGEEEMILATKDAKIAEQLLKRANDYLKKEGKIAKLTLSNEVRSIEKFSGGVILKSGSIEDNNSLERLFQDARADLEAQIAKLLFED